MNKYNIHIVENSKVIKKYTVASLPLSSSLPVLIPEATKLINILCSLAEIFIYNKILSPFFFYTSGSILCILYYTSCSFRFVVYLGECSSGLNTVAWFFLDDFIGSILWIYYLLNQSLIPTDDYLNCLFLGCFFVVVLL